MWNPNLKMLRKVQDDLQFGCIYDGLLDVLFPLKWDLVVVPDIQGYFSRLVFTVVGTMIIMSKLKNRLLKISCIDRKSF
ncbi:hypothetical protein SUVZ_02G4350 [Saccharomyces uvarum]|uniref:Uncharacterized protein n=1 Tax=Saccharomyces uvarum TaxID=230603 RepID=A0ABN8WP07_SACUV|nr:hypothetical protein SUVZ_02G4350 [Saccharomyces uvarum]